MFRPKNSATRVDVFCVGFACIDLSFNTTHHPTEDEKLRATALQTSGGGPASNAAVAIARLDGTAAFCGYLGQDAFGEAHLAELIAEGVDVSKVYRAEAPTPIATVIVKPGGARTNVSYRSSLARVPEDAIKLQDVNPKVLLVDGHQPLLSLKLIETARSLGIPTVLDAGSVNDSTSMLYNKVDYLITSEKFARDFTGEDDPRVALATLDGAAPFVACTWGNAGVYWQDVDGQHHMPAYDVETVDTNGAGDAFHAAFALGIAQQMPAKLNMRRACAVGALTCLKVGARPALPKTIEVERLYKV